MNDNTLKHCPFCGESVRIEKEWADLRSAFYSFNCDNCGMICVQNNRMTKEEAIETWNRRTTNETD